MEEGGSCLRGQVPFKESGTCQDMCPHVHRYRRTESGSSVNGTGTDWLRCHGVGRDRVTRYFSEYLEGIGFKLDIQMVDGAPKATSRILAELSRPTPSVPSNLQSLVIDVVATGSGCQIQWVNPPLSNGESPTEGQKRFVTELVAHMVRTVSTTSRGSGRVIEVKPGKFPTVDGPPTGN